ncbi:CHC2 zinc finger domain-containing protein [Butyrivibrio sp. AC2005]|uniref:CHC2 zinc finger domain-containing protein n=1 Tax=Butyrivibrio sp. AC2005 TaxID=1280672 RepID=UPI00041A58E1|nr:CHC2 zinc finger domain-containing protein [Butyrivibrio sp. AC2005]
MSVFEKVKAHISAGTVITDYGVKVGKNGMACCPFHNDKHPSMKVDEKHYHCFGCGAHGDAISFVAQMEGLSNYDAACKIIKDYGLPIETNHGGSEMAREAYHNKKVQESRVISVKKQFNKWVDDKIHELKECEALIEEAKESILRTDPREEIISNGFAYMVHKETMIGYWLDILCMEDEADKRSLFLEEREEVSRIAANIKRAGNEILGRSWKCVG